MSELLKVGDSISVSGVSGKITRVIERYEVDGSSVFNREEIELVQQSSIAMLRRQKY